MATRLMTRFLLTTARQTLASATTTPTSCLLRLRPLVAAANNNFRRLVPPPFASSRGFATRQTSSSLNDPNPNWSNRPPKETILLDGCDFEHWLVVMEKPEGDPTRDEIIDSYIKTLATVVGSEEEARMKIYSVSTRHYYAFGALVSEELSYKLKELPRVRWVLPDSYLDVKNKDYGGEPFINGQAVPYDPKYHEEWVRNNARANERNRRNDRPRNFDRSRNFERRREMQMSNQNAQAQGPNVAGGPPGNMGGLRPGNVGPANPGPNMAGGPPGNVGPANPGPNMAGGPPGNVGPANPGPNMAGGPPGNMGPANPGPNMGGGPPRNMGPPPNMGGGPSYNMGGGPPNMGGMQPNMGALQNYRQGIPPNNMGGMPPNNVGAGPNHPQNFQYGHGANNGGMPYQSGPGPNQNSFTPNPPGGNYQNQNMSGGDMPPPPPRNYQ